MSGTHSSGRAATPRERKVVAMPTPTVVRRRRTIKLGLAALALMLASSIAGRIYLIRTARQPPEQLASITQQEARILALVNRERRAAGAPVLELSPRLTVIARGHSYDMAIRRYLAHDSRDGLTPADRLHGVGVEYRALGENIFMDEGGDPATLPERAIAGWLASPHHRDNMLSAHFAQSGVGVAHTADRRTYVTQDFIR
jgi:uncharacterized protein YkwD